MWIHPILNRARSYHNNNFQNMSLYENTPTIERSHTTVVVVHLAYAHLAKGFLLSNIPKKKGHTLSSSDLYNTQ